MPARHAAATGPRRRGRRPAPSMGEEVKETTAEEAPAAAGASPAAAVAGGGAVAAPDAVAPKGDQAAAIVLDDTVAAAPTEEVLKAARTVALPPTVSEEEAFDAARALVKQLHESLDTLQSGREPTSDADAVKSVVRDTQMQLLALRRAHRATAAAAESGRGAEALARRLADAEFAHLETRRYESACSRAASRRCRAAPAPELTKLRPCLLRSDGTDGGPEEEDEDEEFEDAQDLEPKEDRPASCLRKRLETENKERARLEVKLTALDLEKTQELEQLRGREALGVELAKHLLAVHRALEPVCNLVELKVRPPTSAPAADPAAVTALPDCLRLVLAKFDVLASFGTVGGVSLRLETEEEAEAVAALGDGEAKDGDASEPPAKKAKAEATSRTNVVVNVLGEPDAAEGSRKPMDITFRSCKPPLVVVSAHGANSEGLLEALWPDDNGQGPLSKHMGDSAVGRPFGWAQVLAGARDEAAALEPATMGHASLEANVTASEVVRRLRERLRA